MDSRLSPLGKFPMGDKPRVRGFALHAMSNGLHSELFPLDFYLKLVVLVVGLYEFHLSQGSDGAEIQT